MSRLDVVLDDSLCMDVGVCFDYLISDAGQWIGLG